jgi:hypothetical protein
MLSVIYTECHKSLLRSVSIWAMSFYQVSWRHVSNSQNLDVSFFLFFSKMFERCHDTQHNDNQHHDTQHNDTQYNDI